LVEEKDGELGQGEADGKEEEAVPLLLLQVLVVRAMCEYVLKQDVPVLPWPTGSAAQG
jgi:hypothetical protein